MAIDYGLLASNTSDLAKQGKDFLDSAISVSNVLVSVAGTVGIAGFLFDIAEDESVELSSIITDHYIEIGSPVQDHIAFRPERVTVRGLVGEYKDIRTNKKNFLEKATQKLTTLASYMTPLSEAAGSIYQNLNTINEENMMKNLTNLGMDLFDTYKNINIPQTEQQKAYIYFEALRNAKATFTIQTPFRYYTDMVVESMRVVQSGATKDQSSFDITFKKIRYVNTQIKELKQKIEEEETQGRLEEQKQSMTDNGIVATVKAKASEAYSSVKGMIQEKFPSVYKEVFEQGQSLLPKGN